MQPVGKGSEYFEQILQYSLHSKKILMILFFIYSEFFRLFKVISSTPMSSTITYTLMAVKSVSLGQIPHPSFGLLSQILLARSMQICHKQFNFSKSPTEYTFFLPICFTFALTFLILINIMLKHMPRDIVIVLYIKLFSTNQHLLPQDSELLEIRTAFLFFYPSRIILYVWFLTDGW